MVHPPTHKASAKSILIVEDDEIILDLLAKGFEMFGLNVFKAGNGLEGWNLFNREQIDIVLTDIRMPEIDGSELSRRIRNMSPNITIAIITGGDADVAVKLVKEGTADYFFMKPFDLKHVCKSLIAAVQTD